MSHHFPGDLISHLPRPSGPTLHTVTEGNQIKKTKNDKQGLRGPEGKEQQCKNQEKHMGGQEEGKQSNRHGKKRFSQQNTMMRRIKGSANKSKATGLKGQ